VSITVIILTCDDFVFQPKWTTKYTQRAFYTSEYR